MKGWLMVVLVTATFLAGCGGGDSTEPAETVPGHYKGSTYYPPGPTSQFVIQGGDNTIQYFGREGTPRERAEASGVVEAWMRARAAKDYPGMCQLTAHGYRANLVTDARRTSKGEAKNCVQALDFFGALATGNTVNSMTGPIDSLRVSHGQGYAQYHGIHGVDWIVPLEINGGEWKVSVSAPIDRTK